MASRNTRDRLCALAERLPVVGGAAFPFMAAALGLFIILTLVAVSMPEQVFPGDDDARAHVLQLAAGLVFVGVFYYATVTLRSGRASQHADRVVTTIAHLGHGSDAVRVGAVALLQDMARESFNLPKDSASRATAAAQRRAILLALAAAGREDDRESAGVAREAYAAIAADSD